MAGEDTVEAALRRRLGRWGVDTGKERRVLAERLAGEEPAAVFYAVLRRRAWIGAASARELVLVRRPRLLPARDEVFRWAELDAVAARPVALELRFAGRPVSLIAVEPAAERSRLIEVARAHAAGGEPAAEVEDLRELARRKLGRLAFFGHEHTIEGLPDRLEPGERVERLATGSLDFDGLLVLTDRRLLLVSVGLREKGDRVWSVPRDRIGGAEPTADGLRLATDSGPVVVGGIHPDRAEELSAVLRRPRGG